MYHVYGMMGLEINKRMERYAAFFGNTSGRNSWHVIPVMAETCATRSAGSFRRLRHCETVD
jgi:hypothetical protein